MLKPQLQWLAHLSNKRVLQNCAAPSNCTCLKVSLLRYVRYLLPKFPWSQLTTASFRSCGMWPMHKQNNMTWIEGIRNSNISSLRKKIIKRIKISHHERNQNWSTWKESKLVNMKAVKTSHLERSQN